MHIINTCTTIKIRRTFTRKLWLNIEGLVEGYFQEEKIIIVGKHLNGHVWFPRNNEERQIILDFCTFYDFNIMNT